MILLNRQEVIIQSMGKGLSKKPSKQMVLTTIRDYIAITIGTLIAAASVFFFMIKSNVVLGSVTGLAVILVKVLDNVVQIPVSVMTFGLNVICLIIGFIFVGKEFGAKTVYSSLLLPVFINMFEHILPNYTTLTDNDIFLDVICCVLVLGIGQAILFHHNASSGGLDIIAKVLNKYFHLELGKGVAITGILTVLVSIFADYGSKAIVVGILGTYFNGLVLDEFIGGFSRRKRVCVLTDDVEGLTEYILHDLNRGVTKYAARGAYGGEEKQELVTILTNSEYGQLMEHIRTNCPRAFVTVSTVNEVVGIWHTEKKHRAKEQKGKELPEKSEKSENTDAIQK